MVLFGQIWLYSGGVVVFVIKGDIWVKVVVLWEIGGIRAKVVVL